MILVVGATGFLGSGVAAKLAESGQEVRGLVRSSSSEKAKALTTAGVHLVEGDLKNAASVKHALEGVDTIVCTASATISRSEGDTIEAVDRDGVGHLIDAAEAAHVKRFIYISFSRNVPADFPLATAKRGNERKLEASKLDWVILLPTNFLEAWTSPMVGFDVGNGKVRIYGDGKAKMSYIALKDMIAGVTAATLNPKITRQAIGMGGDHPLSQLELVALAEKAAKKKIAVEFMTVEQLKGARAGATDSMTASMMGLCEATAAGDVIPNTWGSILDVKPTAIEDWMAKAFAAS